MSVIFFLMSISYMSHVDFKKCLCRPVNFKGQGPHFTYPPTLNPHSPTAPTHFTNSNIIYPPTSPTYFTHTLHQQHPHNLPSHFIHPLLLYPHPLPSHFTYPPTLHPPTLPTHFSSINIFYPPTSPTRPHTSPAV